MTLQDFISNPPTGYNGVKVRGGQCGELVRQYWIDVDHTNPPSYTNSKDYWYNPVPGYDKVSSPHPGDIAIYDGHGVYTEGHSAIYVDGNVFEQNADPNGSPAHLFNRANTYLLGYLRKQGSEEPVVTWNNGDTYNLLNSTINTAVANQAKDANYVGFFGGQDGKEFKQAFYEITTSLQYGQMVQKAQAEGTAGQILAPGTYKVN